MHAFREYEGEAKWDIARWEHHYGRLTPEHKVRPRGAPVAGPGTPAPGPTPDAAFAPFWFASPPAGACVPPSLPR